MDEDEALVARRLLSVHAHPDDETITTGGTIAAYARTGVDVAVLTCTLGEEGEVIGGRWAELVASEADQLGGYRISELSRALAELGVSKPWFLGAAGRWRDSGMAGTPAAEHPRAFVRADDEAVVGAAISAIRSFRPHVVVCYDPNGGYGHPDHIRAHRITAAAVDLAGTEAHPHLGAPWQTMKHYWVVSDSAALSSAIAAMGDPPSGWRRAAPGELAGVAPQELTTSVDISEVLDAKRAALRAHATQITVAESGTMFALSNRIAQPILDQEYFVLVRGTLGQTGSDGREHDLFAGVPE